MKSSEDVIIRPAEEPDIADVKSLFVAAYGEDYPFTQFYDTAWLKKALFDDNTLFMVAGMGGRIVGTVSAIYTAGNLSDLIGEFGRLVVHPDARGHNVASKLFDSALDKASQVILFGFAEARTVHSASQRILERQGFAPIGFEPMKYRLHDRESVVLYGKNFGSSMELRRNNPRLIPEVAPLAMLALENMGLAQDIVVVDDEDGYPQDEHFGDAQTGAITVEDLSERGWSPLLRIERGRIRGREVFGNLSLSHGFFKIESESTRYLVARQANSIVGGLGFTHDPIDHKIRIFELIGVTDTVKRHLLDRVDRIAREDLNAVYLEADVSAYSTAIQRTLEQMGFMAVAYCPSMVFEDVERLDVIRMAKLTAPYFTEDIPLTGSALRVRSLVERSMDDRRTGTVTAEAVRDISLFHGLDEGDMYHLARLGRIRSITSGGALSRQGDSGDRLFVVASGSFRVLIGGIEVGVIGPGETAGEMAILDSERRSADVVALEDSDVVEIMRADLLRLMDKRPRLGAVVLRNLGIDMSRKLRRLDVRFADEEKPEANSTDRT
ncbi:MAG TPA: GNAT family N-acetyltransferase [Thermodesulfovibrionales bacterium]|nr:GNAT family N-acetyltransferase [Thermodesulfovibrionales bacterium]